MAWLESYIYPVNSAQIDVLSALLFDIGAEGIEEHGKGIKVYYQDDNLSANKVESTVRKMSSLKEATIENQTLPDTNWNHEWEKAYDAVIIEDKIKVRASFHEPDDSMQYDILIDPKMSFGTAHHATTYMMMQAMLELDFNQKDVLDFGCGTAVLAILAEKMGAKKILAIDIDEWAYENGKENTEKNQCKNIEILIGDAEKLPQKKYDIVLANVNRNAILESAEILRSQLKDSAYLLLSGLLHKDEEVISEKFEALKLEKIKTFKRDQWIAILLKAHK